MAATAPPPPSLPYAVNASTTPEAARPCLLYTSTYSAPQFSLTANTHDHHGSYCSATTVPALRRQRLHYTRSGAATTFINGSACTVNDAPTAAARTCNQSRPPLRNAATIYAEPSFVVLTTFAPQLQHAPDSRIRADLHCESFAHSRQQPWKPPSPSCKCSSHREPEQQRKRGQHRASLHLFDLQQTPSSVMKMGYLEN
ncbi:hypothetical protein DEO72_LG10g2066 [Vigna unguiculata]|uniref:Uncharacterized protein n=1 Tax=Vigna unguiculata TaxID=3917 RepID=A0A4D6NDL0_VIGUN|nr:hypothetical protein DEO72_LG10g2066 [Vigna unguiculata]